MPLVTVYARTAFTHQARAYAEGEQLEVPPYEAVQLINRRVAQLLPRKPVPLVADAPVVSVEPDDPDDAPLVIPPKRRRTYRRRNLTAEGE